jgi:hypothetical protein
MTLPAGDAKTIYHGRGLGMGSEFTVCGIACNAGDSEDDEDGNPIFADEHHKLVNCDECIAVILHTRSIRFRRRAP